MKKALLLISLATLSASVVGIVAVKSSSFSSFAAPGSNESIVPGSITIGEGINSISNGLNSFKSSNGNSFQFYCNGITKTGGVYSFSESNSYITNYDILNGIYQIYIYGVDGTGDGFIRYGYDDPYENKGDLFELKEGDNVHSFGLVKPNYFFLSSNNNQGEEPILFTKMEIFYSCSEAQRVKGFSSLRQTINGFECDSYTTIILEAGTNLADIPLGTLTADYSVLLNNPDVTDVSIKYTDELLKNSTTVVEGANEISITFRYNGYLYANTETMRIIGYDHETVSSDHAHLISNQYRIQQSNTPFPDDFEMSINRQAKYYDSNDVQIFEAFFSKYGVEITNDMIVSMDADAFTTRGEHIMRVSYSGNTYTLHYDVYDPSYCNIRDLYYSDNLVYPAGTAVADVVADIVSKDFSVDYYDDNPGLPSTVTLTADNLDTYAGMFDNPGYVEVGVHYQNYVGTITVRLTAVRGNFVKTYVNTEGVNIMYQNITQIHLYDNGICEFNEKGLAYNELFAYTLVDGVLSINVDGTILKFDVEDVNNTFAPHAREGTVLYNLKVNFDALGAEEGYFYDGTIYDDNTVVFNIMGMVVECQFTVDANDSNVIYFDFAAGTLYHCKGTIDLTLLQMLVEKIS